MCADCQGSVLYSYVSSGVAFVPAQAEACLKRHRTDSLVEGVGLDRVTKNFAMGQVDRAVRVSDQEVVDMVHFLVRREGVFVGSSSGINVAAAVREGKRRAREEMDKEKEEEGGGEDTVAEIVVVTVLCDEGQRHLGRLWNREFVESEAGGKLKWPDEGKSGEVLGGGGGHGHVHLDGREGRPRRPRRRGVGRRGGRGDGGMGAGCAP